MFRLYQINDDVYASPNVWKIYTVSYMHYSTVGTLVGIAAGLVVSLLFPTDEEVDPKLLTPCIRKFMHPTFMTEKNFNRTEADEYEPVSQREETKL